MFNGKESRAFSEEELQKIKDKLKKVNEKLSEIKEEERKLNNEYIELLKTKSRENIGRCFKQLKNGKVIAYCKITNIDTDKTNISRMGNASFNEYQYPSLWFSYPFNGSSHPFYEDDLFSGAWGHGNDFIGELNKISYIEITKEEFFEKFKEVNCELVKKINDL